MADKFTSFEYDGKQYDLLMTRAGVRAAEAQGLSASEIADKPFTSMNLLFYAALHSKYRVSPSKAAEMLDHLLEAGEVQAQDIMVELSEAYTELFGLGGSES